MSTEGGNPPAYAPIDGTEGGAEGGSVPSAPQQQQQIQYVDQNGNPIQVTQQPQQQVQYVDQNGNPIQVVQGGQQPQTVVVQATQAVTTGINTTAQALDATAANQIAANRTRLPKAPTTAMCPKCQQQVQTRVTKEAGLMAWAVCLGLCCFGCDCGCCLIPFCIDDFKDYRHFCPQCNTLIGVRKSA